VVPTEVDSGDVAAVAADVPLRLGAGEASRPDEGEEAALEYRFAAGVEEQPVQQPHAIAATAAELGQSIKEYQRRREVQPDRAVDGRGEAHLKPLTVITS
jgi:hypothetical protein